MTERTVSQTMTSRHVVSLLPTASIWEAACVMTKANCGSVLILSSQKEILGILTERDLMTRVLAKAREPKTTRVSDVMTAKPHCIGPETTVAQAVVIMIDRGFRHLPVVSAHGDILGVFSARDALPRELDAAVSLTQFHNQVNDAMG